VSVHVDKMFGELFAALELKAEVFVARAVAALVRESAEQIVAREETVAAAEASIQEKHAAADLEIQKKLAVADRTQQEALALQAQLSQQQASLDRMRTQQEADELWTKLAGCVAHEQDLVSFIEQQQPDRLAQSRPGYYINHGIQFQPPPPHIYYHVLRSQHRCFVAPPAHSKSFSRTDPVLPTPPFSISVAAQDKKLCILKAIKVVDWESLLRFVSAGSLDVDPLRAHAHEQDSLLFHSCDTSVSYILSDSRELWQPGSPGQSLYVSALHQNAVILHSPPPPPPRQPVAFVLTPRVPTTNNSVFSSGRAFLTRGTAAGRRGVGESLS